MSTKTRIFQDHLDENLYECGVSVFDEGAIEAVGGNIGKVHAGEFKLSLRESCNKIIHARKVSFDSLPLNNHNRYWNGICHLQGEFRKSKWHISINVRNWAAAMSYYHESLSEKRERFWELEN